MTGGRLERLASDGVGAVVGYYRGQIREEDLPILAKVLADRPSVQVQSLAVYARDLAVIFKELRAPVATATAEDVRRCVQALIKRGSARKRISLLRAALEAAGRADLVALTRKVRLKERRKLQDADILDAEDIARLIRDAPTRRDKCILAVLWESGRRVHEVLAMNVGDIAPIRSNGDVYYRATIRKSKVQGTEGSCLLVESAPYVKSWVERHPLRTRPDAPLFADTIGGRLGRYSYSAVYAMMHKVANVSKLGKVVRPHAFRHARITALLRAGWSDSQVKKAVGLSPASQELARYGHLVSRDIDNAVLAMHGKAPLEAPNVRGLPAPEDLESIPAMPFEPPASSPLQDELDRLPADKLREFAGILIRLADAKVA